MNRIFFPSTFMWSLVFTICSLVLPGAFGGASRGRHEGIYVTKKAQFRFSEGWVTRGKITQPSFVFKDSRGNCDAASKAKPLCFAANLGECCTV